MACSGTSGHLEVNSTHTKYLLHIHDIISNYFLHKII